MTKRSEKTVLFLCTGDYYRSRFAEVLFNAHLFYCQGVHKSLIPRLGQVKLQSLSALHVQKLYADMAAAKLEVILNRDFQDRAGPS